MSISYRLIQSDAVRWARHYAARRKCGQPLPLFHALLCDPPYHLTTITKRFGKAGSKQAQYGRDGAFQRASKGFMGKTWDGGDVAFRPSTWRAFYRILHPGAFGMAFGGSRTSHRMAVAIEDAGFRIHPMIGWVYGSGFPKATRLKNNEAFEGHRYGLQALKPALEPIIVFQKPYKGKPIDSMVETGAGALNIDEARIGMCMENESGWSKTGSKESENHAMSGKNYPRLAEDEMGTGRWPANFTISHAPGCQLIGSANSDGYVINTFKDGAKPFGDGAGHVYESEQVEGGKVGVYQCVKGCAVRELGDEARYFYNSDYTFEQLEQTLPMKYQAKANKGERNAGLENFEPQFSPTMGDGIGGKEHNPDTATKKQNPHPTIKAISLTRWLAALLLPPDPYAPRRLFVPFAGVASEMIGAYQAGWEAVTGIELGEEYTQIGQARLNHWMSQ